MSHERAVHGTALFVHSAILGALVRLRVHQAEIMFGVLVAVFLGNMVVRDAVFFGEGGVVVEALFPARHRALRRGVGGECARAAAIAVSCCFYGHC